MSNKYTYQSFSTKCRNCGKIHQIIVETPDLEKWEIIKMKLNISKIPFVRECECIPTGQGETVQDVIAFYFFKQLIGPETFRYGQRNHILYQHIHGEQHRVAAFINALFYSLFQRGAFQ